MNWAYKIRMNLCKLTDLHKRKEQNRKIQDNQTSQDRAKTKNYTLRHCKTLIKTYICYIRSKSEAANTCI
jgi:hypothetical protein